jgi:hypothetical protein
LPDENTGSRERRDLLEGGLVGGVLGDGIDDIGVTYGVVDAKWVVMRLGISMLTVMFI